MRQALLKIVVLLCSCACVSAAEYPPSQMELNGFLLGQYDTAIADTFGEPERQQKATDGWIQRVYFLNKKRAAYMVFEYAPEQPKRVIAIQLTGESWRQMHPFLGLKLGDSKEKVLAVLGQTAKVTHESDVDVDLLTYDGRNYSVEINRERKLSSIRILGYTGFDNSTESLDNDLSRFRRAVIERNIDEALNLIAGDFEIYHGDQVSGFSNAARTDLSRPDSRVAQSLWGPEKSLREVFASEKQLGETEMRLYEKGPMGVVLKFPKSNIIREAVFSFEGGHWRLYELAFR